MDKPTFVSRTYIRTTPEQLWQALTEPAFTQRYWGVTFESDWRPGSPMTWNRRATTSADPEQVVLEAKPPRRLSYTWHTFTPELADAIDLAAEARERIAAEPRSRVTFEIEPLGDLVKLTVLHDGFAPGSVVAEMVSQGWPRVVAGLKTLPETGEPLPDDREPSPPERLGLTIARGGGA